MPYTHVQFSGYRTDLSLEFPSGQSKEGNKIHNICQGKIKNTEDKHSFSWNWSISLMHSYNATLWCTWTLASQIVVVLGATSLRSLLDVWRIRPHPNLPKLNQHFNKIPRTFICTLKLARYCFCGQYFQQLTLNKLGSLVLWLLYIFKL